MTTTLSRTVLHGDAAVAEGAALGLPRQATPARRAELKEAAELIGRAFHGNRRAMLDLAEKLATSDFQVLFGNVMDRELQAVYTDLPATWSQVATRTTVRDFKPKKMIDLLGGRGILEPVAQLTPYPARALSEAEVALQVGKLGGIIGISWEMIVNDDLDALRDLPNRLATGARDTEQFTVSSLLATATGPNAGFFKAANKNLIAGNPLLTFNALSDALTAIRSKKDPEGRPIIVQAAVLVVPPALEMRARSILDATEIRTTVDGQEIIMGNPLRGIVSLVVDPWLSVIDTSATGATTWYLLPATTTARPALALGFLRGYEVPDLRIKADTGSRVGGGSIAAEEGSFEEDGVQYRVRHVLGAAGLDPIATAVSKGSGS